MKINAGDENIACMVASGGFAPVWGYEEEAAHCQPVNVEREGLRGH